MQFYLQISYATHTFPYLQTQTIYNNYFRSEPQLSMTKFVLKTQPAGPHVELSISTWIKDSHGLYDYEGIPEAYIKETYYIRNSGPLLRDPISNTIVTKVLSKLVSDKISYFLKDGRYLYICRVEVDNSKVTPTFKLIFGQEDEKQSLKSYLVIGQNKESEQTQKGKGRGWHRLSAGNVVKLGRMQFLVNQIKGDNQDEPLVCNSSPLVPSTFIFNVPPLVIEQTQKESPGCRICLCQEQTQTDPLISPCKCKGSCSMIHVGCLRTWVNSKVRRDCKGVAISYNFTNFDCQICKDPLPQVIKFQNNKQLQMLTLNKPSRPYICLQSLLSFGTVNQNQNNTQVEGQLHILSPSPSAENLPIRIGRNNDSEIRLPDISVSRKHAEIVRKDGDFWIGDCGGKFGTLIKMEGEIQIGRQDLKLQIGRSLFTFKLKGVEEEGDTQ